MKYKGIEIKEFTSENPVIFTPPKLMLVWNEGSSEPSRDNVFAFIPKTHFRVIGTYYNFDHCAEIPEESSGRATNRELAKWLVLGNGQYKVNGGDWIWTEYHYDIGQDDDACSKFVKVRKWGNKEWHEPTREYLGLEDKSMELNEFDYKEQGQDHIGE